MDLQLISMPDVINFVKHLYTTLLSLYPQSFREEFAEEMQDVFADSAIEAYRRGALALLSVIWRELRDMPVSLGRQNWHALAHKERSMNSPIEANGAVRYQNSDERVSQPQAPWRQAVLAGLPHLLYVLSLEVPSLLRVLTSESVNWHVVRYAFWALVVLVLIFAWRRGWSRWSASWVGYGLVLSFDLLIDIAQNRLRYFHAAEPYISLLEGVVVIIWLVMTTAVFFWMAKRDWFSGLLVVLPVVPIFFTYIVLDGVKGTVPEALLFIAAGLLMSLVVVGIVRTGNLRAGVWLVLVAFIVIQFSISYASTYHSNVPIQYAVDPTLTNVVKGVFGGVIIFAIFSAPLWLSALWTLGHRLIVRK